MEIEPVQSIHTDGTKTSASQSQPDRMDIKFAMQRPLKALRDNIWMPFISDVLRNALLIFMIHIILYYQESVAVLFCQLFPIIEVLEKALPIASIVGSQIKIADSLFQRQYQAAGIYFTYAFFLYIILTIASTFVLGGFSNQFLQQFQADSGNSYFQAHMFTSFFGASLMFFLQSGALAEKRLFECGVVGCCCSVASSLILIIGMLLLKNNIITNLPLSIVAGAEIASCVLCSLYFLSNFVGKSSTENHLELNLKQLSPLRWNIMGTLLKKAVYVVLHYSYESVLAFVVVLCYSKWIQQNNRYGSYSIVYFFVYRCMASMCNSFNAAMTQFLEGFFASNLKINNLARVNQIMMQGHVISIGISALLSGVIYWMSGFVSGIVFIDDQFSEQEVYQLDLISSCLKFGAASGVSLTARAFVQALCAVQSQKFVFFCILFAEYAYVVIVGCYYLRSDKMYNYSRLYLVGQLVSGLANWIFYVELLIKQQKQLEKQNEGEQQVQTNDSSDAPRCDLQKLTFEQKTDESKQLDNIPLPSAFYSVNHDEQLQPLEEMKHKEGSSNLLIDQKQVSTTATVQNESGQGSAENQSQNQKKITLF